MPTERKDEAQVIDPTIKELKKRYDAGYAANSIPRGVNNELERYVVPYRGRMFTTESGEGSVIWDKYNHYDDTAPNSAQILASHMHGAILPKMQWFNMVFTEDDLNENNEASDWLSECATRVYDRIAKSNFLLQADELFLDLTGFGHGFMIVEEDKNGKLYFDMIPIKEVVFEESHDGSVWYFFRKLQWTPTKIVSKFGYDSVPDYVKRKYDNPTSADERIPVIFALYPRTGKAEADVSKPLGQTERPWEFRYFLHYGEDGANGINEEDSQLGEVGGYYHMPVYSVRWRKVSGSQWGHGPAHICLGEIKQLNQHKLMRTRAVEKVLDPAIVTTKRGLISNLDLGPRGVTVVREMGNLEAFESKANFTVSREDIEDMRSVIRQAFRVDQLQLKDSPAMTAAEVHARLTLMQQLLGPTLSRIRVDWLDLVVEHTFQLEMRNGNLPEMPEVLRDLDPEIEIEYLGALATAQKQQMSNDMLEWAGAMAQLSEAYPDMKYAVNADQIARLTARNKNIPERAINGVDEAKRARQEDEERMRQMQEAEQARMEGEAAQAQGEGAQAMRAVQ